LVFSVLYWRVDRGGSVAHLFGRCRCCNALLVNSRKNSSGMVDGLVVAFAAPA
jgi:hypothetical protein